MRTLPTAVLLFGFFFLVLRCPVGHATTIYADGFERAAPRSDADAARFLDQATFGGRLQDIQRLRAIGYDAWFEEQFAARISLQLDYLQWVNSGNQAQRAEAWLINAAQLPEPRDPGHRHDDQLRQRAAFALSQIFVVSEVDTTLEFLSFALVDYYDSLSRNAFANFRDLLEVVTLHPVMGEYLNMRGSRRANFETNSRPDENFPREVLQLFTIGLHQLNLDGSPRLAGGQPIPTFNSAQVRGFARAFSGWDFADCDLPPEDSCNPFQYSFFDPMVPREALHEPGAKQLLSYPGVNLPDGLLMAGGTARENLRAALDNIFFHPNVGPFISRQLIQRLVTSNPAPDYVSRVASVFNDNGQGIRGDMRAVYRAILLDTEARQPRTRAESFGKLREPLTKLVRIWRVAPARSVSGRVFSIEMGLGNEFGQLPLASPSVFNFFRPGYAPPGEIAAAGLVAPEFQIVTDRQVTASSNFLGNRIFNFYVGSRSPGAWQNGSPSFFEVLMDYGELRILAQAPAALIDRLDMVMMSGSMSPSMRQLLLNRLNGQPPDRAPGQAPGDPIDVALWRVQQALYLIVNSPEFSVQQ